MLRNFLIGFLLILSGNGIAQQTISGNIIDKDGLPLVDAEVMTSDENNTTFTDDEGYFELEVETLPVEIIIQTYEGNVVKTIESAEKQTITLLPDNAAYIDEDLEMKTALRQKTNWLEKPGGDYLWQSKGIIEESNAHVFNTLINTGGATLQHNGIHQKTFQTRGFVGFQNNRQLQLIDGVPIGAPSLQFNWSEALGTHPLDIEKIEIAPGANLRYPVGAYNGLINLISKSPFDKDGISFFIKGGVNNQATYDTQAYYNWGLRYARNWNDKLAVKLNFSYINATDWLAEDVQIFNGNAPNIYGDEAVVNLRQFGEYLENEGIIPTGEAQNLPSQIVQRTGFMEREIINSEARSIKADASFYWKVDETRQFQWQSRLSSHKGVLPILGRLALEDFILHQHRLSFQGENFLVQSYVTFQDAGNSFDLNQLGGALDRSFSTNNQWFQDYALNYLQNINSGIDANQSAILARMFAQRFVPDDQSEAFNNQANALKSDSDVRYKDQSNQWRTEGFYRLPNWVKDTEITLGGAYQLTQLNTQNTLYGDGNTHLTKQYFESYAQVEKSFFDGRLLGLALLKFEKDNDFKGIFGSQLNFRYLLNPEKNSISMNFNTSGRSPDFMAQFLSVHRGDVWLLGASSEHLISQRKTIEQYDGSYILNGYEAYQNSYLASSVAQFDGTNPEVLEAFRPRRLQNEYQQTVELGYHHLAPKFLMDVNVYFTRHQDLISMAKTIAPLTGTLGSAIAEQDLVENRTQKINYFVNLNEPVLAYGGTAHFLFKWGEYFQSRLNYTFNDFIEPDDVAFPVGFNTPKHQLGIALGNSQRIAKHWGFNIRWQWMSEYHWEDALFEGDIPERNTMDAQVSYKMSGLNAIIELGANNAFRKSYQVAIGQANIGAVYYVGIALNP